jgi:hypothetical protein
MKKSRSQNSESRSQNEEAENHIRFVIAEPR